MPMIALRFALAAVAAAQLLAGAAQGADYPPPKSGNFVIQNFKFHTGDVLPELRVHYTTVGNPSGEAVIIMHGTGGAGSNFLSGSFAGLLFGPGQPLDASKYYIILPDAIGSGQSSKPSDGMKANFPKYDYADIVAAEYQTVVQGLGVRHARLVMGNSMGGMLTWIWGEKYPDFMDALVPMASTPGEMSGRNWMLRRMMVQMVLDDPAYANGNYTKQPLSMRDAAAFYGIATSGGTLALQAAAPTRADADDIVDGRLFGAPADANDFVYEWLSSGDFNPTPGLKDIKAALLAINSADDERNPPETGIMDSALKQIPTGKLYLIPASVDTRGHGTTGDASFWIAQFKAFLAAAPHRGGP